MSITLSHQSALDVVRILRFNGVSLQEMDEVPIARPSSWAGKRWGMRCFSPSVWDWPRPERGKHLHVAVPQRVGRIRMANVDVHTMWSNIPPKGALWLDENASFVCPELLFLQMAEEFSLPALVLLGYELCGNFTRSPNNPLNGSIRDHVPAATCVAHLLDYLAQFDGFHGVAKARNALKYVCDHALSAPEAVLATMYALPVTEAGYGMGPVTLNEQVDVGGTDSESVDRSRYPDLMFGFASVGINYDGEDHLDLKGLVDAAQGVFKTEGSSMDEAQAALLRKLHEVRAKVVDDNMRNRQLAAAGKIVFPATKEDLQDISTLDNLTRQILGCANAVFGADVQKHMRTLNSTAAKRDRGALFNSIIPGGTAGMSSYGHM